MLTSFKLVVRQQECKEARSAHEDSISRRGAGVTSLEGVEQNPARIQEYSAVIEISANAESPYRTVRVTYAPGRVEQLKVHGSRRVLEVLLLTWRSGVQLKELSRHIQERRDPQCPWMQASAYPGSVLTVKYERDIGGHPAEINASLMQTLLESPRDQKLIAKGVIRFGLPGYLFKDRVKMYRC